jgi:hypothetical protein
LAEHCQEDREISGRIRTIYEQGCQKTNRRREQLDLLLPELERTVTRAIADISVLIERLQELRRLVYTKTIDPVTLELQLNQITTAYDSALSAPQFDILLKELREGKLSVIKLQVSARSREAGEDYDFILQNCLIFFNETKKYLEFIEDCIQENKNPLARMREVADDNNLAVDVNLGGKTFWLFRSSQGRKDLVLANQYLLLLIGWTISSW